MLQGIAHVGHMSILRGCYDKIAAVKFRPNCTNATIDTKGHASHYGLYGVSPCLHTFLANKRHGIYEHYASIMR